MKFLALILLSIAFCSPAARSQKLPNTLLWRISGNGLQKPSYLYGTMHLTDQRLFNLGDSLYKAIENTEGFAIEVNPEEVTAFIIDEINEQIKNAMLVKDVLNEKEFKEYGSALSKKLKKPADKITTRDIFIEKNKWIKESFQKGEMSTFLDAYLFDIARRQGKWTGGVEDMDDQKGLLNDLVDKSDIKQIATGDKAGAFGEADSFIKLYLSNNLNAIDSATNDADSGYIDNILTKRNIKMARRIDSLVKIRTMVFAVGAAHLPGKQGLISLLQNRGYNLQPVFYSKKIKPADYKVKEIDIPWVTINDPDSFYKIKMPGNSADIEMFGVLKMKMNFDIFNSTVFMVTAIPTPYNQTGIDSIMNFFAVSFFKEKNPQMAKNITINSISGKELESTDESGYKHGYILYKNHIIYLAIGLAVKKNIKSENELIKFLSSYEVFERKKTNKPEIYTYTDSVHLFTIDLPSKPQSGNDLVSSAKDISVHSHLMLCFDRQTGAYFFFGVNLAAPGYFIEDDSTALRNIEKGLTVKFSEVKLDTIYNENKNRVLKMEGIMLQANVFAKAHYEVTGNRWYALLAMYDSSKVNPVVEQFFRSFKIFGPPASKWSRQSPEDGSITMWVPGNIKYYRDSNEYSYSKKYEAYDSAQGNSYDVIVTALGKYYWQNGDSALWNAVQKSNTSKTNRVLSQRSVSNGSIKGIELQLQENSSFNIKRKRTLLFGDSLYVLITVQPKEEINDSNISRFFDDFRFNRAPPASTVFTSKAIQLVNDLSDEDSATKAEASRAISNANFGVKDLSLLYGAFLKTYTPEKDDFSTINEKLARAITNIKDSSSLRIAKEKYLLVSDKKLRSLLLDIISEYKTKQNFADLKNLLLLSPPDTLLSASFINNVKDSPALAAGFIPGILPLLKDSAMAPSVVSICADLVDSNIISILLLHPYFQDIAAFADNEYKKLKKNSVDDYYPDRLIIDLLGKMNDPKSNVMLQRWLTLDNSYLNLKCVEALLLNGQVINTAALVKLAGEKSYRIGLYNALKKMNKEALFPKQYLTRQYFAESNVYTAASYDDEPSALTYLTQKIVTFHGKKAIFFFYKVTYGDNDKTYYLACAGPFDLNQSKLSAGDSVGSLYFKESFDKDNLQQQINALVKQVNSEN